MGDRCACAGNWKKAVGGGDGKPKAKGVGDVAKEASSKAKGMADIAKAAKAASESKA